MHALAGEVARVHVAVDLGLEHEAIGQAAELGDDDADPALGVAVVVRRVEEVERALEDPSHGGQGVLERDLLLVGQGRVPEWRAADAQRRDLQPGPAQRAKRKALSSIGDHAAQHMGPCVRIMRLGAPLPRTFDSPEGWIALLRERGFRTAYWPLADDAAFDEVDAYASAAVAAGISIAEVGAWEANPLSRDDAVRAAGAGALPVSGSRSPTASARAAA